MWRNLGFAGVLLAFLLVLVSCTPEPITTPIITPITGDTSDTVRVGDITASGTVITAQETGLSFEMLGRVHTIYVEVGDDVVVGQPLIQLDTADVEANIALAEAALVVAQLDRARLDAPPDASALAAAELDVRAATVALSQTLLMRDAPHLGVTEVERLSEEASIAAATADRREAFETHEIMLTCVTIEGYGEICPLLGAPEENTRFQWEASETNLAASQASLSALKSDGHAEIKFADANVNLAKAQKSLAEAILVQLNSPATPQEIQVADAAVIGAQAAVEATHAALSQAVLKAPVDGTVINVVSEVGEVALPAMPLVTLADLDQFQVETTNLSELDIARVKPGQRVTLFIEALQDLQIEGTVQYIDKHSSLLGGDVVYAVTISLDEIPSELRLGMSVDVIIHTE